VVVADFDFPGIAIPPAEADPPLIVDANTVLADSIASEPFEPIPGQHTQLLETPCRVEQQQFPMRSALHLRWQPPRALALEDPPGLEVPEGANHPAATLTELGINGNRHDS